MEQLIQHRLVQASQVMAGLAGLEVVLLIILQRLVALVVVMVGEAVAHTATIQQIKALAAQALLELFGGLAVLSLQQIQGICNFSLLKYE
jgi:hypothetical protein